MENFILYDEIGRGDRRIVYKGRRRGTIEYVAIHCIEKTKKEDLQHHVRVSHKLSHRNVVTFYEWYETSNHFWLVVELCTGDTLRKIIEQDSYLPEATVLMFGRDLVCGLAHLHTESIIYGNICPQKVILDCDGTLKYFNFSKSHQRKDSPRSIDFTGYNEYLAPELLNDGVHISMGSDFWCLGCILYELFTGRSPFHDSSDEKLYENITRGTIPYPIQAVNGTFVKASENLFMLIQGLLQKDVSSRIDWLELCLHPVWEGALSHLADTVENLKSTETNDVDDSLIDSVSQMEITDLSIDQDTDEIREEVKEFSEVPSIDVSEEKPCDSVEIKKGTYTIIPNVVNDANPLSKQNHCSDTPPSSTEPLAIPLLQSVDSAITAEEVCYSRQSRCITTPRSPSVDLSESTSSILSFSHIIVGNSLNVIDHLFHTSDLEVTPIAENPKLIKQLVVKFDASSLGFIALTADKLQTSVKDEIKKLLEVLFKLLGQSTKEKTVVRQKMNLLAYLLNICKLEEVSNCIIRENHHKCLVKELKTSQHVDIKTRIGRVLGIIGSRVTSIPPSFNMTEVFSVCADQIKQNFRLPYVKQAFLPAIGELLFFAATQEESEGRVLHHWEPSGAVFTIVNKCLQQMEDHVARHLAAKIIENITTTTGRYCKRFLNNEVGLGLWNLYSHAGTDVEKATASSALSRLSMHSPTILQHVCDRAGFDSFQVGMFSSTLKSQQSFVTVFVTLLSSTIHSKRIVQDKNLLQRLGRSLESPSFVLCGKVYLLLSEMVSRSHSVLLNCCELRLLTCVEKNFRKSTANATENTQYFEYAGDCLSVFASNIVNVMPEILKDIIEILTSVRGRHHPNPAQTKQLKTHLPLLSITLHMVTSSMFRKRVIKSANFFSNIGQILQLAQKTDSGEINLNGSGTRSLSENLLSDIFSIIEAITQHPLILMDYLSDIVSFVMPVVVLFTRSDDGNLRMLSLKLFTEISATYLESEEMVNAKKSNKQKDIEVLLKIIESNFLESIGEFLVDQEPLPSYCLKLLHSCADKSANVLQRLLTDDIMMKLLGNLRNHATDLRSPVLQSTVGILNAVIMSDSLDFLWLCRFDFVEHITSLFMDVASVVSEENNSLLLQLLDTIHHAYKNIEREVKSVLGAPKNSASTLDSRSVEELLKLCDGLCEVNGLLINLLVFNDSDIQEWSCRCLYLSAELFGGAKHDWLTRENLAVLFQSLLDTTPKRQKLLLRVLKRWFNSSAALAGKCKEWSSDFEAVLYQLTSVESSDRDSKYIQNISSELKNMLH